MVMVTYIFLQTPSKKKLEIVTVASNYHMEVNPSDVGIYDRVVVQEMIKSVASTHQLDATGQKEFKGNVNNRLLPCNCLVSLVRVTHLGGLMTAQHHSKPRAQSKMGDKNATVHQTVIAWQNNDPKI